MKAELDGMNARKEPQRINVGSQCRGEVIANPRLTAFVKTAPLPEILLRFVEDLNPHPCGPRSLAFTSSHSRNSASPVATR